MNARPRKPIQPCARAGRRAGAPPSEALMKTSPRLKNQSEKPNESSASRSRVCQEQEAAPVDETEEEDGAERDPRPPGVQHLAAERARPGRAPSSTRPAARSSASRDAAVAVLDLAERDLARAARPDPDRPASRRLVEGRIGLRLRRVARRASAPPSGTRETARRRASLVSRGAAGVGANGSSTVPRRALSAPPVGRCCRRRPPPARAAARARRRTPTASPAGTTRACCRRS